MTRYLLAPTPGSIFKTRVSVAAGKLSASIAAIASSAVAYLVMVTVKSPAAISIHHFYALVTASQDPAPAAFVLQKLSLFVVEL